MNIDMCTASRAARIDEIGRNRFIRNVRAMFNRVTRECLTRLNIARTFRMKRLRSISSMRTANDAVLYVNVHQLFPWQHIAQSDVLTVQRRNGEQQMPDATDMLIHTDSTESLAIITAYRLHISILNERLMVSHFRTDLRFEKPLNRSDHLPILTHG